MFTLADTIEGLLLPVPAGRIDRAVIAASEFLDGSDVGGSEDRVVRLQSLSRPWIEGKSASAEFAAVVEAILSASLPDDLVHVASKYFDLAAELEKGSGSWAGLTRQESRFLLSHLTLIHWLLSEGRVSSAQVTRLLRSWEASVDVSWRAVSVLASRLGFDPNVSKNDEQAIWDADSERSEALFPDADIAASCQIVSELSSASEFGLDLGTSLQELSDFADDDGWPYLQILHFATLPVELFDHPSTHIAEFSPRGSTALQLFGRYGVSTGNPILNNAKAVQDLDARWAQSRGNRAPHSLARILRALDGLPYPARRNACRLIRSWLARIIFVKMEKPTFLDHVTSASDVLHVREALLAGESRTAGVVEQRFIDFAGAVLYSDPRWVSRGLGDHVNANNYSRRKLGDIEFQDLERHHSDAIEVHAGRLTKPYVDEHLRSLQRGLPRRLAESWSDLAAPEEWTLRVIFLASEVDSRLETVHTTMNAVRVSIEYRQFYDFVKELDAADPELIAAFNKHFVDALNRRSTRQVSRDYVRLHLGR